MSANLWLAGATSLAAMASCNAAWASSQDLSEVVVTAAPYAVSAESTITSVDVLRRDQLDRAPSGGLGDVLGGVPGVRSSFFGPGASRPIIRGLAGPRVLVLANGVGLIDASGLSPDHQVASDPQEAERIEVLRGPSALSYGGSAIGGVVNVIDDRIPDAWRPGLHGRALGAWSSVDRGGEAAAAARMGLAGGWTLTLDGVKRRSGDYMVPVQPVSSALAAREGAAAPDRKGGRVGNSHVDLDAVGGGVSYVGDQGWGGLSIKRTESSYGSPAERDVHIALRQTRLDVRGGLAVDLGPFEKVKFTGGWADYRHTEFEDKAPGATFLSDGLEGRVELVQRERRGWLGAVGAQALRRNFDAIGNEVLVPRTRIEEFGVFTLQRLDLNRWGLEGGVRLDNRRLDSVAGQRDFTGLSASTGAFIRPSEGWFLALSASRTSRAPTEEELFSNGPHPATGAYQIGFAGLRRELSRSLDATLHYRSDRWMADLHAFAARYVGFIDLLPTGATDPQSGLQEFRFVQTSARFRGAEAEGSFLVWRDGGRSLRLEGAADYVRGQTGLGPAARIPPWSAAGRIVYEGGRWSGSLEVRRVGSQSRLAASELPTEGYATVNLSLSVRPIAGRPDLRLFLDARNLGDAEAREHASFLKDVAPLPGRNIRTGLSLKF